MVDIYKATFGQAYMAAIQEIVQNLLNGSTPSAGWYLGYNDPGLPSYPGITINFADSSLDRTYWFADCQGRPGIPVRYLLRQPELSFQITTSDAGFDTSFLTLKAAMDEAFPEVAYIIGLLSGYSEDMVLFDSYTFAGKPQPAALRYEARLHTSTDIVWCGGMFVNEAFVPGPFPIEQPSAGTWWQQATGSALQNITIPAGAPPWDADVAINQGQAIFSVISRTTTMLP
jgi:hypothetical protein